MTSQLNADVIRNLRGSLMCLVYFFDMLSMGVCTTRHWQMSGRLVQELSACSVGLKKIGQQPWRICYGH